MTGDCRANRAVLMVAYLRLVTGCSHRHQQTWKHTTIEQMHATLAEQIPPQTPLEEARAYMEKEGFKCSPRTNELFVEQDHWAAPGVRHSGLNYVHCHRGQGEGHFLMSRIWNIALVHDGHVVTDVLISMYVDGP